VATGTFDILHPGHVHYLERSKALGDELVVIVARDVNVKHKPMPIVPQEQRRAMVAALKVVDRAVLGCIDDIFRSMEIIKPDILTLGYDQHFDQVALKAELDKRGLSTKVVKIDSHDECELCSSRKITAKVLERSKER
jgi:FAD synthetase